MDVRCATCGAENPESARFCRKCGTPLGDAAFTEAPTRSLDGSPDTGQPARSLNTFPSAPFAPDAARYAPPIHSPESANLHGYGQVPAVAPPSHPAAKSGSSGARWLLIVGAFLLLAIFGGAAAVAVIASKIRSSHGNPPIVVSTPTAPAHEDADEDDDDAGDEADVDDDYDPDRLPENVRPWYYENAVGAPTFTKAGDVTVLIMKTTDSPSDVAEFYREHFKEIGITPNSVEQGSQVVFSGEESAEPVNVVIQGNKKNPNDPEGKYTRVIVQLGGVKISIPTIPGFGGDDAPPAPPAPPSDTSIPKPPAAPKAQK